MKKKTSQFLAFSFLIIFLISCSGVSQKEYEKLKAENEILKKEIEELKFGADKLLSQAKIYINNKDFINAKSELQTLLDIHPTSLQSTEAKTLLKSVENGINNLKLLEQQNLAEKERKEKELLSNVTKKLNKKTAKNLFFN